jgi:hypothetical protein
MCANGRDILSNIRYIVIKQFNGAQLNDSYVSFFENRLRYGHKDVEIKYQNYTRGKNGGPIVKTSVFNFLKRIRIRRKN